MRMGRWGYIKQITHNINEFLLFQIPLAGNFNDIRFAKPDIIKQWSVGRTGKTTRATLHAISYPLFLGTFKHAFFSQGHQQVRLKTNRAY